MKRLDFNQFDERPPPPEFYVWGQGVRWQQDRSLLLDTHASLTMFQPDCEVDIRVVYRNRELSFIDPRVEASIQGLLLALDMKQLRGELNVHITSNLLRVRKEWLAAHPKGSVLEGHVIPW